MESQFAGLKQELQIKSADMKRLAERSEYLERELQQVFHTTNLSSSDHILLFPFSAYIR